MAKRKADNFIASDNDEDEDDVSKSESEESADSEQEKKSKSRKVPSSSGSPGVLAKTSEKATKAKTKTVKKPKFTSESADGDDVVIHTTPDGEKYLDLGKKRRASVRNFKGNTFLDIREFYGVDGDEKPGKKGISLTIEQWDALKDSTSAIDSLFSELKKKK